MFQLPPETETLRDSVRGYFERHLPETKIRAMDRDRRIPWALWNDFAEQGWMGMLVPEAYGGSDAGTLMASVLTEEISRHFPSIAVDLVLVAMTARLLTEVGSEAQKADLLPKLAGGEFLMAFGMSEPDGGTDVLQLKTQATHDGTGWKVRGQKLYTSLADDADAILVLARTEQPPPAKRARGLSLVLTPRRQPRVRVRRLELMGIRAAGTCEVLFDDATCPRAGR